MNEELPPDLRALDQMCLSVQFYLLGALHCSGIVFAVLGYMLALHQRHNLFGDPMVMPLFFIVSAFLSIAKKAAFKIADRLKIWMVEGEAELVQQYDEGPGSRQSGAMPPGMAAVRSACVRQPTACFIRKAYPKCSSPVRIASTCCRWMPQLLSA